MAQQLLRSPALGAPQRRTQPTCAFQTSKLLSIRVAPQRTTSFVSSSSPAQTARPLSRPLRCASDDLPSSWDEALAQRLRSLDDPTSRLSTRDKARRQVLWNIGTGLLGWALLALFVMLYPNPTPDSFYSPHMIAAVVWMRFNLWH